MYITKTVDGALFAIRENTQIGPGKRSYGTGFHAMVRLSAVEASGRKERSGLACPLRYS